MGLPVGKWEWALWDVLTRENDIRYWPADKPVRTSRVLTFPLALTSTRDRSKVVSENMEEDIAMRMGVESVRISRSLDTILVETQLPTCYHRPLLVRALKCRGRLWFTLGQNAQGRQVHVNLGGSLYPHALVAATTGGGKTFAMWLLLWELVMHNTPEDVQVLIIDGKGGVDWRPLPSLPHLVHPVVSGPNETLRALAWALAEMERREQTGQTRPALFVFVDEVREMLARSGGNEGDAAQAIERITSTGRGLGIHMIVATQHPTSEVLGGSIAKANLPLRLAGRVLNARASNLVTGQKGQGAHKLYGEGDFLAEGHRVQVALVDDRHIAKLPRNGHNPQHIDLSLDLARVMGVVGNASEVKGPQPDEVAWALQDYFARQDRLQEPSANAIREHFGGAMDSARGIRDYAKALLQEFKAQGLRVTPYSDGVILPAQA